MALFGFGKKKEGRKGACCCACTPDAVARAQAEKRQGGIKVLGGGCAKCHELEANTKAALASLGLEEPVELITDADAAVAGISVPFHKGAERYYESRGEKSEN